MGNTRIVRSLFHAYNCCVSTISVNVLTG